MTSSVFSETQFNQIYPEGIENHFWNHARNRIILNFLRANNLQEEALLEIGGGRGIVTKFLHDNGLSCVGYERAPVQPLQGTSGYFFTGIDVFDLPAETKKSIRAILLFDVIEHMESPEDFLENIIEEFSNIRYVIITVPARPELWTNFDEFNGHYRRYTMDNLKALTTERMIVQTAYYFNHMLYPVFLLLAKWSGNRETIIHAPRGFQIFFHRLLSWLLQLEFKVLPRTWKGTSLIALLRICPCE